MELQLKNEQFNRLFPFHLILDRNLNIISFGKSIQKLLPVKLNQNLHEILTIKRPAIPHLNFENLIRLINNPIILDSVFQNKVPFRGAVEYVESSDSILLILTPWFSSMKDVKSVNLQLNDFAIHDPLIDLLHSLQTQEIVNDEVKELLNTVRKQKKDLQRLSLIVEESVNAIVITNNQGEIEWVNKAFFKTTGYTLEEIKGKKPGSFLQGKNTSSKTISYLSNQIKEKEPFVCEILNYTKNEIPYWVRINGQPLFSTTGVHTGYFAIQEDITLEKQAFLQLKDYEERFKIALEKIGDNVWVYDFDTKKSEFSKGNSHFLGSNHFNDEFNKENWLASIHPDDYKLLEQLDKDYTNRNINFHSIEYRVIDKNGNTKWVLDRGILFEQKKNGLPKKLIGTHTDITQIKESENELNKQKKFYENILNNIPSDIAVFDAEHRYRFLNPIALKDSTIRQWIIGKKDEDYFKMRNKPIELASKRRELFNAAVKSKKLEYYLEELINKDGNKEYHLRNMYPVLNENNEVELVIGYGLNITDRVKIEKELEKAKLETEETAKAKETFLINMSHEIRTPMNGIMGITDLLIKTKLNKLQKEYTQLIQESANNLVVIINDVLDLEKMMGGKLELETIPFDIAKKIKITVETFRYKAEEKDLFIKLNNQLPEEFWVYGDQFRLNQIITNLIGNAIKFTEIGGITVNVEFEKIKINKVRINISISDTGIGIQNKNIETIFNPYVQAKAEISRKYGGTGLGLSICKKLVDLQNGIIEVKSTVGVGSTFSVKLDYKQAKKENITQSKEKQYHLFFNKRILIAEDVEINQYVLKNMLELWGAKPYIVENGKKAVEAVKNNNFDLVLMDIQMPELNGFEAAEQIRKLSDISKASIPIIAVTANSLKGISTRYHDSGMNDYLIKPYNEEMLYNVVHKLLINSPQPDLNFKKAISGFEKKQSTKKLLKISGGDIEFQTKLIEIFLRTAPEIFLNMESAFAENDWENLAKNAHKLSSSVGSLGFKKAHDLSKKIEANANGDKDYFEIKKDVNDLSLDLQNAYKKLEKLK